ncbi:Rho guanine nucleotide exchange factor 19 [Bagarius yarrelli]|uniref:Rho guanine nucleotide exchange factor 19 n=1 Tax=Bagarius yarrelli TaxID=175774 RepID=A0A556VY44_BAGYA|nr:Rho guanine nucleotide exchange factor 19 [Bagarius yarrelli]
MNETSFLKSQEVSQSPGTVYSVTGGIADALRSVASSDTWCVQRVFLQTASLLSTDQQKPFHTHTKSTSLGCEPHEDERCTTNMQDKPPDETFKVKLKYINDSLPLYQEYWLNCMKAELQKAQHKKVVDVVEARCRSAAPSATSPVLMCVSSPPGLHLAPYALWQQLPEVKRLNLLHTLSARDVRHQEAMFELIVSEASYQKSLRVAVGLFQSSAQLKQTLTPVQNHVLFSNLKEVCKVSEGFLQDLETRLGQNVMMARIGDIVLNHKATFHRVYVPYVSNMMYQETLIAKLLQENRKFVLALKKLEKDPLCQRQTLKSFLILPFQRITRLRLILENILKKADELSTDIPNLKDAIEAVREIVVECDRNVQQMKRTEELVSLEKHVDFANVKSVPLIVSGRYLKRAGSLKKLTVKNNQGSVSMVSRTDIFLHLFNDLLLLSFKNGNRFSVQDHAAFPTHVRVEEMNTKILGLPPDSFLLHLTQNHLRASAAVILSAQSSVKMAATRYRRFLKLCEVWPKDESKKGRDLGMFLRQKVASAFREGENTQISDPEKCDKMYESLVRINSNVYKEKFPRVKDTSFTGVTVEECRMLLETENLQQMDEEKKGLWKSIIQRFSSKPEDASVEKPEK